MSKPVSKDSGPKARREREEILADIELYDRTIAATESAKTKREKELVSLELDQVAYKCKRQRLLLELEGEYQPRVPSREELNAINPTYQELASQQSGDGDVHPTKDNVDLRARSAAIKSFPRIECILPTADNVDLRTRTAVAFTSDASAQTGLV